jgi:uncharacterized membrane protein
MVGQQTGSKPSEHGSELVADHVRKTVGELLKLEHDDRTRSERVSDHITAFTGSMGFVALQVILLVFWVFINLPTWGFEPVDPFPYKLMTTIVSVEAIFLATFVLISANRQAKRAEKRAKVDLQVNMIAEQEVTKLMDLILDIHDHLGIRRTADIDVGNMQRPTDIQHLVRSAKKSEGR